MPYLDGQDTYPTKWVVIKGMAGKTSWFCPSIVRYFQCFIGSFTLMKTEQLCGFFICLFERHVENSAFRNKMLIQKKKKYFKASRHSGRRSPILLQLHAEQMGRDGYLRDWSRRNKMYTDTSFLINYSSGWNVMPGATGCQKRKEIYHHVFKNLCRV